LLETQELQDGEVDAGVKTETTLVRTEGRVELDTVSSVNLELALVVLPRYTELDETLRNGGDLKSSSVLWLLLEQCGRF